MLEIVDEDNLMQSSLDASFLESIINEFGDFGVELVFVDSIQSRQLNKEFLHRDYATDVLSFPFSQMGLESKFIGSIVINIDLAKKVSLELNHSINEEIALLFIHGFLHLMGYDHEIDSGEQRSLESKLINKFNLPKSLIIRNED